MTDDFAGAATKGAAACRQALAAHRGTPPPATPSTRPLSALLAAAKATPAPSVQPAPATAPEPAWTPHDAMPATATPGHWADGSPLPDEPPPEEDWQ